MHGRMNSRLRFLGHESSGISRRTFFLHSLGSLRQRRFTACNRWGPAVFARLPLTAFPAIAAVTVA